MKENSHLLPPVASAKAKPRHLNVNCCIKSKIAGLILLWNSPVLLIYVAFNIGIHMRYHSRYLLLIILCIVVSGISVIAPIAGLLTDLKYSRYKTVTYGSCFLLIEIASTAVYCIFIINHINDFLKVVLDVVFAGLLLVTSLVIVVNLIQFGMDQLHDSPTDDSILFIHWYVWIYYLCSSITSLSSNFLAVHSDSRVPGITAVIIVVPIISILTFSLCVSKCKKKLFLIQPVGMNPYKLVYRVVKFACQHKVPLRRSAFTYCEDEFPPRMDLGKLKYGGPFTTKQVEDVKAFLGILKVLTFIGPVYMIQIAAQSILSVFERHNIIYYDSTSFNNEIQPEGMAWHIFISKGLLSPLLIVICIPLYLCLIRPHTSLYVPGMLKRIGLGIILLIVSLLITLAVDVMVHLMESDTQCMFNGVTHGNNSGGHYTCVVVKNSSNTSSHHLYQNIYFFISQHILAALSNMLIDIAVLEFILSQSPYSMKGLLLGYFVSMKSLFQAVSLAFLFPFGRIWHANKYLSCGSGYYLMNIIIVVLEFVLFTSVAKRYKFRTVSEPSNEYRYAEEYYSNIR